MSFRQSGFQRSVTDPYKIPEHRYKYSLIRIKLFSPPVQNFNSTFFIWNLNYFKKMNLPLGLHDTSANTYGTGDNALLFQSTQSLHCESAIVLVSVHSDSANDGNILLLTNIQ